MTRFKLNKDLLDLTRQYGLSVVFVTHSVLNRSTLSDRILVMTHAPGASPTTSRLMKPARATNCSVRRPPMPNGVAVFPPH